MTNRFISQFSQWMKFREYPIATIRALPRALRTTMGVLRERDTEHCLILRNLHGSDVVLPRFECNECSVYPSKSGSLVVGAVVPDWKTIAFPTKNEVLQDLLEDFFGFCEQYIARSRALRITGAAALAFDQPYEFRFGGLGRFPVVRDVLKWSQSLDQPLFCHDESRRTPTGRRQREFLGWVDALNSLDPSIHRAVFQYWRAIRLSGANFWEEAITALDGLTSLAAETLQKWLHLDRAPTRSLTGLHLSMDVDDQKQLQTLYEIRCDFGAHPSPAKWWDFAEMYETELDGLFALSKRLLGSLCRMEYRFRSVEPTPAAWSFWFEENAHLLLDAVWFTRIR